MADKKIENGQEIEEVKSLSLFDEKMKGLLDDLDERLEQIGGDFGPILMEELQNRLERIVKNFNENGIQIICVNFRWHELHWILGWIPHRILYFRGITDILVDVFICPLLRFGQRIGYLWYTLWKTCKLDLWLIKK